MTWQPDLGERQDRIGELYGAWEGTSPYRVTVILDPPKHALPAGKYSIAQRNSARIFSRIPGHEPFVVGLQEDFWKEIEAMRVPSGGSELGEDYLARDGLGIVQALSSAKPRPPMARLEDPVLFAEYKTLEKIAISVMNETAAFFGALAAAFRSAERTRCSKKLGRFMADRARFRREHGELASYMAVALETARSTGLDLESGPYRTLLMYERMRELESALEEDAVKSERDLLMRRVKLNSEALDRRACWAIYRACLENRHAGADEATQGEIEKIEDSLEGDELQRPPPQAEEAVAEEVRYALMTDAVRAKTGVDKIDILGARGEHVSNLLELASALGIDVTPHIVLADSIEYAYLNQRLETLTRKLVARHVDKELRQLEKDVTRLLAETEIDRAVVELDPAISIFEALGRYQILHDENLRRVMLALSVVETCETLAHVGIPLPDGWQDNAHLVDSKLEPLRDYYDRTIVRGMDLAESLVYLMQARNLTRGVLYCDGYFSEMLSPRFEGRDVSYVLVTPSW